MTKNSQYKRSGEINNWNEISDFYDYQLNNKNMKNGLLKLNKTNVYSALVYGFVAVALVVISQGTVFGLNWKALVDVGIVGVLTSLVKNLLTTEKGNFLGSVKVIPDIEK
jgi:hypothetical protein